MASAAYSACRSAPASASGFRSAPATSRASSPSAPTPSRAPPRRAPRRPAGNTRGSAPVPPPPAGREERKLMTDMRGLANVNAQNVGADGAWLAERLLRDGTGVGCDWRTALAMQGRVFSANFGQGYTPLTFTTFAAATPMAAIRVPAGIVIFPLAVMVGLDVSTG